MKLSPNLPALLLGALLAAGCGAIRSSVMDLGNTDLVDHRAPELRGTAWIDPGGELASEPPAEPWTLLAFFKPD